MSKRRGFTLVEVLVVMALVTLVFAMVGGLMIYMAESTGKIIDESEQIMTAQIIRDHLRGVLENGETNLDGLCTNSMAEEGAATGYIRLHSDGALYKYKEGAEPERILDNTGLSLFIINLEPDDFYSCTMTFDNGAEYKFILGVE